MANDEEALEKVNKMEYLTNAALKEKETQLQHMDKVLDKARKHLNNLDKVKGTWLRLKEFSKEAVAAVSEAKDEAKEWAQISKTTHSKVPRNKRKAAQTP